MLLQTLKSIRNNKKLPKNVPACLQARLRSYGLAPHDWQIEASDSKYVISHINNKEFKFIGYLTPDHQDWKSLHLYSL